MASRRKFSGLEQAHAHKYTCHCDMEPNVGGLKVEKVAYFQLVSTTNRPSVVNSANPSVELCKVSSPPSFVCSWLTKKGKKMEIYLPTVSERHILSLTKAHTCLSPWVWWQWCRKSELQRTPLFSKHSDRGEKLIIQS